MSSNIVYDLVKKKRVSGENRLKHPRKRVPGCHKAHNRWLDKMGGERFSSGGASMSVSWRHPTHSIFSCSSGYRANRHTAGREGGDGPHTKPKAKRTGECREQAVSSKSIANHLSHNNAHPVHSNAIPCKILHKIPMRGDDPPLNKGRHLQEPHQACYSLIFFLLSELKLFFQYKIQYKTWNPVSKWLINWILVFLCTILNKNQDKHRKRRLVGGGVLPTSDLFAPRGTPKTS